MMCAFYLYPSVPRSLAKPGPSTSALQSKTWGTRCLVYWAAEQPRPARWHWQWACWCAISPCPKPSAHVQAEVGYLFCPLTDLNEVVTKRGTRNNASDYCGLKKKNQPYAFYSITYLYLKIFLIFIIELSVYILVYNIEWVVLTCIVLFN